MSSFVDIEGYSVKFSDINQLHLKRYLNIEDEFIEDDDMLFMYIVAAKSYVIDYTNLTLEELDNINTVNIAVLLLAGDFYQRRSSAYGYDNNKVNFILKAILDQHRKWL